MSNPWGGVNAKYCHAFGVCVTNNNGFWIRWLDLLALLLQLQSIMTAHNQWLSMTSSIPCWTTSVFSSTMMNDESLLTHWTLLQMNYDSFITSRQPEYRSPYPTVLLLFCVIRSHGNLCLPNRCLANGHTRHNIILYSLHMQPAHPSATYISCVLCRYFTMWRPKLFTLLYPVCLIAMCYDKISHTALKGLDYNSNNFRFITNKANTACACNVSSYCTDFERYYISS
jgi:hypothetical protein